MFFRQYREATKESSSREGSTRGTIVPERLAFAYAKDLVLKRYHWAEEYIEHDYRIHSEYLPYERWVEILEIIAIDESQVNYREWEMSAFVGWQNSCAQGATKDNFEKYKRNLGIRPPKLFGVSLKKEKEQALERLKRSFGNHVLRDF